jgi:hypothetical protein
MLNVMAIGSLLVSLFVPAAVSGPVLVSPAAAPTDKIVIDVATVNGSGCPAGTAAIAMSPDNTAFTVTYSNYTALVGVGALATDFRKNCQLNLIVHVPNGFTYAVASVDYRGFSSLAQGATGTQRANYYFQGLTQTAYASHAITTVGPYDWQFTDTVGVAALSFAPCGEQRNLNINTELRVAGGTSNLATTTSFVTMDSTDGDIDTKVVYHLNWKACP